MKFAPFLLSAAVFLCAPAMAKTPAAGGDHSVTATCKDGTTYTGKTMRGACRGHGGVDKSAKGEPAAAAAEPARARKAAEPAGTGVSAVCKDGTTYTGKSMRGACRGHGGVDKSKSAAPASGATAPAAPAAAAAVAAAPGGGGAGKVWVNTESKVYHCQGDRFYGKTKKGEYMSEAQAKAQGFRASHDKACGAS
jgi:hypothetical protein